MMDKRPLVSVIMPAYNTEKYIGEAIQSVIDQTVEDWEIQRSEASYWIRRTFNDYNTDVWNKYDCIVYSPNKYRETEGS